MRSRKSWLHANVEIIVPFHDVDSMEVVWHGHYARYLEIARCAALDKIQYNYNDMRNSGYAWPVIDMHIRYVKPLVFGQRVEVQADLVEYENRMLFIYVVRDYLTQQRLSRAQTAQVAVKIDTGEMLLASPSVFLERLGVNE